MTQSPEPFRLTGSGTDPVMVSVSASNRNAWPLRLSTTMPRVTAAAGDDNARSTAHPRDTNPIDDAAGFIPVPPRLRSGVIPMPSAREIVVPPGKATLPVRLRLLTDWRNVL